MRKQEWRNLVLDGALLVVFLVLLKPFSITGLALHEWLGIGIAVGLVLHIGWHRKWIIGVSQRLGRLPMRTRLYYLVDAALLVAFGTIIVTGMAMSQSFLPALGIHTNPTLTLATVHRVVSYGALGLLGIKIALHWRWLMRLLRKGPKPFRVSSFTMGAKRLSRRSLLAACGGLGCLVVFWQWYQWKAALKPTEGEKASEIFLPAEGSMEQIPTVTPTPLGNEERNGFPIPLTALEDAEHVGSTPQPTETLIPTATPQPVVTVRCPYGMVNDPYPGRCRRYVDANGSGYCDLSESA